MSDDIKAMVPMLKCVRCARVYHAPEWATALAINNDLDRQGWRLVDKDGGARWCRECVQRGLEP